VTKAILLLAYGGPDSLDDIQPYLLDIRGGRPTPVELVDEIRQRYARIGGRSPLLEITRAQAAALESSLAHIAPGSYRVYVGMRHWHPYIAETVSQMAADGMLSGMAICMAPHASRLSSGAYLQKLRQAETGTPLQLDFIETWFDQPFLIRSLAEKVRAARTRFSLDESAQLHYLFTAHSLPAALKEQGDPYESQLLATADLLAAELGLAAHQHSFAYQSAGAAAGAWLGPAIEEVLSELAQNEKKHILVTPVGFLADHVEILFDLDIEAQEIAHTHGIHLVRSESLNATPGFIQGLAHFLVQRSASKQSQLAG
jgi:protoporphyrin/coproporphyrin ferrochelatase